MMTEKCVMEKCERIWNAEIKSVNEKINGVEKLQASHGKELERRMHEANDIKKEFGNKLQHVETRVARLETRSVVWLSVITFGFMLFQIIIGIIIHYWK